MPRYFAYCTLLDTGEMARFCPDALPGAVGWVEGYRVGFATHAPGVTTGGCTLEPAAGMRLYGLLYDMSDATLVTLDELSGVPSGSYAHVPLQVTTEHGETVDAITYTIPNSGGPFAPSAAYVRPIRLGARGLGLEADYLALLDDSIDRAQGYVAE